MNQANFSIKEVTEIRRHPGRGLAELHMVEFVRELCFVYRRNSHTHTQEQWMGTESKAEKTTARWIQHLRAGLTVSMLALENKIQP